MGEAGKGVCGKSLYFLFNFAVNLKLLPKLNPLGKKYPLDVQIILQDNKFRLFVHLFIAVLGIEPRALNRVGYIASPLIL